MIPAGSKSEYRVSEHPLPSDITFTFVFRKADNRVLIDSKKADTQFRIYLDHFEMHVR